MVEISKVTWVYGTRNRLADCNIVSAGCEDSPATDGRHIGKRDAGRLLDGKMRDNVANA
ncbi:hypothetical protein NHU_02056 [Rhodovulum sulfidophilum]|uniref:Uncharacterized protein n=1 Tax=Rhodovulum sulfidophilum TaxID=35806 RepID=A0A0D6B2H7_RHOSU|nr:hypothetical protein NHU_02056 [Rhodovulum sulfidophilum]